MQANWSLILNVLLLIGVVIAIGRLMKARRQDFVASTSQPSLAPATMDNRSYDDIIAVRKVPRDYAPDDDMDIDELPTLSATGNGPAIPDDLMEHDEPVFATSQPLAEQNEPGHSILLFLLARDNRQLAGYELLQTVLAAGLRFGEGHLFHRHQNLNGQGPVLFSLAAATATGVFDLQNIGAFSVRGLCLFMESSGNATIDGERLSIMLETARQLSEDLGTHLLDGKQKTLTDDTIARYYRLLNSNVPAESLELA